MSDFRKPHGNRGNARFGRKDFSRPSFGNRGGGFSRPGGGDFRPAEMHQAVCSRCGTRCEVPFRPNGKKPVYCKECFEGTTRGAPAQNFERRTFNAPPSPRPQSDGGEGDFRRIRDARHDTRIDDLKRQMDAMQSKLDRVLHLVESADRPAAPTTLPAAAAPQEEEKKTTLKKATPKKKKA